MGPVQGKIIAEAYRFGEALPERIKNAPLLFFGLEFYYSAFFELDTERSHGNGLTQIPRSAVINYANEFGLDEQNRSDLVYYVRKMDDVNLEYLASKLPKPGDKGSGKSDGGAS